MGDMQRAVEIRRLETALATAIDQRNAARAETDRAKAESERWREEAVRYRKVLEDGADRGPSGTNDLRQREKKPRHP